MNNPYDILGVSPNATDEQVKSSYRELAKKYHPDNYADNPLKEFADEKMRDINAAYDDIMNSRRAGGSASSNYSTNNSSYNASGNSNSKFADIRSMIQSNRLVEAEELLDGVPIGSRDAEWYFLKGSVYYSRGWLDDALNNFTSACRMEPNNTEYRAALNRMGWQRSGGMGGYGQGQYRTQGRQQVGGCTACDICQGLICLDCLCDCLGSGGC